MPITFTNNFKNILDKLRSILRTEFKGALPVYIGHETRDTGTQYLRLNPVGSNLLEYNISAETREFTIEMFYYFSEPNVNKNALDQVLRVTSRIEALIHDNMSITLTDSSRCINCRVETTELNALDDENEYVVQFEWLGQHTANIG
tara:strand:+ start:1416 stop:1853 length:438 start_codon:yes stop_codon:yes gene_type:complete